MLKGYTGITLWPFVVLRDNLKETGARQFAVLVNHERIHIKQQLETLVLFFYVLYLFFYIKGRIQGLSHQQAYMAIPFEKESYMHEKDITYLKHRKLFGWYKYTKNNYNNIK